MDGNLGTTNLLLGIMAAVSALQGLLLVGACIAGWKLYRRTTELMSLVEAQHVAPTMARVHVILDHVTAVAQRMRTDTEQVERAIRHTIDRVDGTAQRVKSDVRVKTSWIIGAVRGVTVALQELLRDRPVSQADNDYATPGRTH